jgi:transposase
MLGGFGPDQVLLADRAYDSDALGKARAEQGAWVNACPRESGIKPITGRLKRLPFSPLLYRYRNLVELP